MSATVGEVKDFDGEQGIAMVDAGLGGSPSQVDHYEPCGLECNPVPGDKALCVPAGPVEACAAYADARNGREGGPGDQILHGRDPSTGARVCRVKTLSDGTIEISNSAGAITLKPDGSIDLNGVVISPAGILEAPELKANGIALGPHIHVAPTGGGSTSGPQAPPPP